MPEHQDAEIDTKPSSTPNLPNESQEFCCSTSRTEQGICACHEVSHAYKLLHDAATTSIAVPAEVVIAINDAHALTSRTGGCKNPELETKFWNAYSLLSSIKPADRTLNRYKWFFYAVLTVLLTFQVYYLVGSMIITRLTDIEKEWQQRTHATTDRPQQIGSEDKNNTDWERLRRVGITLANDDFAKRLVPLFQNPPAMAPEFYDSYAKRGMSQKFVDNILANIKLKNELELNLIALSAYILPLLYGALGAFAFILRKLSDPVTKLTYAHDVRITYWMRLNVGALAGLAVGWFINGNSPVLPGFAGLSPLALAFVAGYAFDPFFNALDKVAATFGSLVTSQPSDTSRKSDTTYSGKAEALQHS